MNPPVMSSALRLQTAMSHKEADRVPFLLPTIMQGAKLLGLSIEQYLDSPQAVAEGQLRLREHLRHDAVMGFLSAATEAAAFGADIHYSENGPPNAGAPSIKDPRDIDLLPVPEIDDHPGLLKTLEVIKTLARESNGEFPVMAAVVSPFSLPIMQMGFGPYIELIYDDQPRFWRLMETNIRFVVRWANAQLEAGATAISYADPMSSATVIPPPLFLQTGWVVAQRTLPQINGPMALSLASGRGLPILKDIIPLGFVGVSASILEDLSLVKAQCANKLTVMGNLNGIEMVNWTPEIAQQKVKQALRDAAPGGGFVLTDNHGEIPWQVPDEVLVAIRDAVEQWGNYPLEWLDEDSQ